MGKRQDAPAPPDPHQTAAAQTNMNRDSAEYNAALNRVNTYTPLGSQTFDITGKDPRTGAPIYRQDIKLSPEQQQLYDQQMQQNQQLGGIASGMMGQLNQSPFSLNGLPEVSGDYGDLRKQQSDAIYNQNAAYLDPQFEKGEDRMRSRLANQGITEGSEAYNNASDDFGRQREFAYGQARNQAIAGGGEEASRAHGIQSNMRNNALAEMLTKRNQPMNEFNAFRSASPVNMPQFQGMSQVGTNPADIQGAINNNYQGQVANYNAGVGSQNSLMGGLFGLGSAGIMALSDERAKEDIHELGELNDGTSLYMYRYKGDDAPQVGVMAQQVEKTQPDAVVTGKDGLKRVNYSKVLARALEAA